MADLAAENSAFDNPGLDDPATQLEELDLTPAYRLSDAGWERLSEAAAPTLESPPALDPAAEAAGSFFGFSGDPEWSAKADGYDSFADRSAPVGEGEQAPSFKVRIGRLELIAPTAPSPPRRRRTPRPGPRLSLDDYMKRRRVGRS